MKKALKRTLLAALAAFVAIQFVPVDRTNPPVKTEIAAPAEIHDLLRRSCYDCHSNQTRWPFYAWVAPVSWFVVDHVEDGRADLNLTEWPLFDAQAQQFFLGEMKSRSRTERCRSTVTSCCTGTPA